MIKRVKFTGNAPKLRSRQRGSAAIEFAMLFAIMFVVAYGAISYALVMLLQQSLTQAANEGARVAASKLSEMSFANESAMEARMKDLASAASRNSLNWLPQRIREHISVAPAWETVSIPSINAGGANINLRSVTVVVTYPNYASLPLVPTLSFPGFGSIPGVPNNLVARATVTP
jgi:Flp pilus assembly protein TadG